MSPYTRGIEASWVAYRNIRKRFELNKVYGTGLRFLIATAYLPGTPLAFAGLPAIAIPAMKVSYAISRASNPPDILPFIIQASNPATQATWTWGIHRGGVCSSILQALNEGSEGGLLGYGGKAGKLIPIVECAGMALEAAKILMEIQAGSIMMGRVDPKLRREFPVPDWLFSIRQVFGVLRGIGGSEIDGKGRASPIKNGLEVQGGVRGENVLNGISNLLGSMVRMADEWYRLNDPDESTSHNDPYTSLHGNITEPLFPTLEQSYDPGPSHSHTHSHQGYMDTSDRWMASEQEYPNQGGGGGGQIQQQQQQQPMPIDFLLSQMFNYNSIPGGGIQQSHGHGQAQGQGQGVGAGSEFGQMGVAEGSGGGEHAGWGGGVGHS
jgi:hypothetical protein